MKRLLIAAILILYAAVFAIAGDSQKTKAPVAGKIEIQHQGGGLSLNVVDADLTGVLRAIAEKTGMDLTLGEGISGRVSIRLINAGIEDVLKKLCRSSALVYEYLPEKKSFRILQAAAFAESPEKAGDRVVNSNGFDVAPAPVSPETFDGAAGRIAGVPTLQADGGMKADNPLRPRYKSGELLVKFKKDATAQQIEALHQSLGSVVIKKSERLRLQRIKLREGLLEEAAMALYAGADIVEHAEKHAIRYPNLAPDDPYYAMQWGLARIAAPQAWDITRGSSEVVIAVIDSGVDYQHEDLKYNIWINTAEWNGEPGVDDDNNGYIDDIRGWDFADGDVDPMDPTGHGTHVAGIIAAQGNNGLGTAGVVWQVKIMPLKVQTDDAVEFLEFALIEAIQYAIDNGAMIVNCSFGGHNYSIVEENAFADLRTAGILAICAAGNDTQDTDIAGHENYPAGYNLENIISVAAADSSDNLAYFSNYGHASVDLMAPGVDIYSTMVAEAGTDARVRVEVDMPVEYPAIGMLFAGTTPEAGITAAAYDCGKGYPEEFPGDTSGYIAVIERGSRDGIPFYFSAKLSNAQTAGAAGVIIYNNVVDGFDAAGGTLETPGDWLPAVSITQANGLAMIALEMPQVTLFNVPIVSPSPYNYLSGTSMAAPHVTGIAGLIRAQCPALGYSDVKTAILNTVDKVSAVEDKIASGGRVNAQSALSNMSIPGDLSRDCRVGLEDAVLGFQVLAEAAPALPYPCLWCGKDVNGDSRVGSEEILYILQKVAGLRE